MSREIQCGRKSVRRFLWRAIRGQSIHECMGSGREAAAQVIEEKEYAIRPIAVIEVEQKHMNMRAYIAGVLMMTDGDGNVIENIVPYACLLGNMSCNDEWICIGERNKDNIFHVHVVARCSARTDSFRRTAVTVWNTIRTATAFQDEYGICTMDMLKCQKAHKPSAILEYMHKAPEWICSTSERLLQLSTDIIEHDMCARFKGDPDPKPDIDKANPMIQEILQCIMEHQCKTVEDVMKKAPDMVVKHLHRPGINSIITNCLTYAKCTGNQWSLKTYGAYTPNPGGIHAILLCQGHSPTEFDYVFWQWITKRHNKRNTICLLGPSNTGKSSFCAGLGKCCPGGEIVNGINFNFEGLIDQYWGKWEEPLCSAEIVEKVKQVLEGMETAIPVKFKKPYILPRIPIFITTNAPLWTWCSNAKGPLKNRMWEYEFTYDMSDGVFTPRFVEPSCECYYCQLSRGCTPTTSSAAITGVSRTKQSISKQLVTRSSISKTTMGSGPMSEGTGSSGSIERAGSSRGESSSDITIRGSTSTTISNVSGSSTESGSSSTTERICSPRTKRTTKQLDTSRTRGYNRDDNSGNGGTRNKRCRYGRDINEHEICTDVVSMGRSRHTQSKMEISTKKQHMDQQMVSLNIPDKPAWQQYLAYIYRRYEQTRSDPDLHAYESLDSESE
uniref:Nonstructural protein 1 n=1 Tax=Ara ararauna Chaphamaparvovirus TaxID=2794484 RepID=A0A8A4XDQ1_9VIRU|nr:MAG: nonstructural protein 1 [Ara ararauna Chaphamaparvovirus]